MQSNKFIAQFSRASQNAYNQKFATQIILQNDVLILEKQLKSVSSVSRQWAPLYSYLRFKPPFSGKGERQLSNQYYLCYLHLCSSLFSMKTRSSLRWVAL